MTVVRGACHHDCPDTCVWEVTVENSVAVRLRGADDHPTTAGELCPKVNRFLDRVYHPERLRTPLRRVGDKGSSQFEPVSWDDAISQIAARLTEIGAASGGSAILPFSFDGTQGRIQKGVMADRFFAALGSSQIRRHLCGVTAWMGAADVSGVPFGIDPEDLRHARTILLWGTNTRITNRHLWPTIQAAREEGATVVVIDPVRTITADQADRFVQLRPGSDVALVLGMIHVLDRDGLIDREFLDDYTTGWPDLRMAARRQTLPSAAAITGVDIATIEWLATTFATRRPAAIRVLVGPEHREHGRELFRAVTMLPAVVGAWRERGGGLARSTQVYFEEAIAPDAAHPSGRVFNMAELGTALTDADPPIEALIVHNSNPAVIVPDQNRVLAGLGREDLFTVVIEQFMTDTARYADIVLPATTQLEHLDLMVSWGHLYMALNRPAIAPVGDALPNTEIFRRLAVTMGLDAPGLADDDETLIRQLLATGHPYLNGITYERLREAAWVRLAVPAGFRPYVDDPPRTADGRLRLGDLAHRPGSETAEGSPELASRFPLTLLSMKQHPRFLNANYGGFAEHLPRRGEPQLEIHAIDATARGLADGMRARVFNDRGELDLVVEISDRVQPGVVAAPFGWWASTSPGGRTVNALTNPATNDGRGSAAFHETLVEVERA